MDIICSEMRKNCTIVCPPIIENVGFYLGLFDSYKQIGPKKLAILHVYTRHKACTTKRSLTPSSLTSWSS